MAPPETQITMPPAAPARKTTRIKRNSDTTQAVAPRTVTPAAKRPDPERRAAPDAHDTATRTESTPSGPEAAPPAVTAAVVDIAEPDDRPVAAAFTRPAAVWSTRVLVDVISDAFAPRQNRIPIGLDSSALWAVLGWARRQFSERFASPTALAKVVQTTQIEPPPTRTIFFETSPRVSEAAGTVLVPIVRTGDLTQVSTIEYGITSDTATAGVDYVAAATGTITMGVGVDHVYIPVQIVNDDVSESTETFVVSIINVDSGSTILFPRTARIDILDDENPVVDPPSPPLTSDYIVTEDVVASGLNQPLAFEFAPHDSSLIFVAEKGGVIKVVNTDTGTQSTFIDISSKVNNIQDRGLMDIALHPDFGEPVQPGAPEHNYVYAFYVVDPPGTTGNSGNAGADGGGNRFAYLVRFTADASTNYTTVVPGSEVILLGGAGQTLQDISGVGAVDSTSSIDQPESGYNAQTGQYLDDYIKVDSRSHAGGSLAFGPDGALYVSIGDGTSFNTTDPRTISVQNVNSLSGKILRIDPITGLGLPDNPFVEPGDDLSANHSKVYQMGLRNPFSIGFTQDGRLFMSNTGWNVWEEIESGHAGANFGWPYFEGGDNGTLVRAPGYQNLPGAAAFYAAVASGEITITPAYRGFAHAENVPGFQVGSIVGVGGAYTGSRYPSEFRNNIFFTDTNDGEVYVVDVDNRSLVKFLYRSQGVPIAFSQGPDGYVYVANLGAGSITRLRIEPADPNNASEKQLEEFKRNTGWIPVWGALVSAVSVLFDLNDFIDAQRDGRSLDLADESGDLLGDVLGIGLGLLPGGIFVADAAGDALTSWLTRQG